MDALYIFVPIVITTTLHMFLVKYDGLKSLNKPIATNLFGENKTWRGAIFVMGLNTVLMVLLNIIVGRYEFGFAALLGVALGFGYIVFELPNSFLKRKLGIPPGGKAKNFKFLFMIIDRFDSAFGVILVYSLMVGLTVRDFLIYLAAGMLIHFLFSSSLYMMRVKKTL